MSVIPVNLIYGIVTSVLVGRILPQNDVPFILTYLIAVDVYKRQDLLWNAQSMLTPLTIPTRFSTGQLPAYGVNDAYSP